MRPTYDIPAVKRLILERLAAGATLAQLEATAGFPSAPTVRKWAQADAGFAAGLGAARAARRGVRVAQRWARTALPAAWAAAFVGRVRRGEAVGSLVGGPGQPSRAMLRAWRAERPEFDAAVAAAVRAWRGARAGRRGYDEAVADRIVLLRSKGATMAEIYARADLPGKAIVARWRRMVPEFDGALRIARKVRWSGKGERRANRRLADAALVRAICDHIMLRRGSLRSAARAVPGAPSQGTLYAWRRRHPAFALKVALAMRVRDDLMADEAGEAVRGLEAFAGLEAEDGLDREALAAPRARLAALRLRGGQLHAGRRRG